MTPAQFLFSSRSPSLPARTADADILVVNADGTGEQNVTNTPGDDAGPAWSPDGTKIAYNRYFDEIYSMNADGTNPTPLTGDNTRREVYPDWQPCRSGVTISCRPIAGTDASNPPPLVTPLPPGTGARGSLRLKLSGPTRQRFKGYVTTFAQCSLSCSVGASASVSVPPASKVFRSKRVTRMLGGAKRSKLKLKFSKKATREIRRALANRKRLTARVKVVVRRGGANSSGSFTAERRIKLKP